MVTRAQTDHLIEWLEQDEPTPAELREELDNTIKWSDENTLHLVSLSLQQLFVAAAGRPYTSTNTMELIVAAGFGFDQVDLAAYDSPPERGGFTALEQAMRAGNYEVLAWLLEHGINVDKSRLALSSAAMSPPNYSGCNAAGFHAGRMVSDMDPVFGEFEGQPSWQKSPWRWVH
ncbi:MAG: hypothetical protein K0U12_05940 [Gammaproteobacteria bacterium]|nr:hypothetical protein [Gammaproteobacteria bacterium]